MSVKIDSKTWLAFAAGLSGGIAVGALGGIKLYKERKGFKEWIDNTVYPGLEKFIKENGITMYRIAVVTVFEKKPKARALFLAAGDSIESGSLKIPKNVEKMFYKQKDELPVLIDDIEKKAHETE